MLPRDISQSRLKLRPRRSAQIRQLAAQIRKLAARVKHQGGDEGVHRRVGSRRIYPGHELSRHGQLEERTVGLVVRKIRAEKHLPAGAAYRVASKRNVQHRHELHQHGAPYGYIPADPRYVLHRAAIPFVRDRPPVFRHARHECLHVFN